MISKNSIYDATRSRTTSKIAFLGKERQSVDRDRIAALCWKFLLCIPEVRCSGPFCRHSYMSSSSIYKLGAIQLFWTNYLIVFLLKNYHTKNHFVTKTLKFNSKICMATIDMREIYVEMHSWRKTPLLE